MALPPKFDAGGTSGVTGLSTVNVPALPLPALVVMVTRPVEVFGTVKMSCVVDALVTVAATPLTVMVLFTAVALNPVPTTVTLEPISPCEGVMLETVTDPLPVVTGVNTITGFNWVLLFVPTVSRVRIKSTASPFATENEREYGYDVDTNIACVNNVVEFSLMVNVAPAGVVYNNAVPVTVTVPAAGAVQRTTAPRVAYEGYPCINPLLHTAKYNSLPSHFAAPALYASKSPFVSRYDH